MRFLEPYLAEKSPTLRNFAKVLRSLEQHQTELGLPGFSP
jgi:hypothetical protein